MSYSMEELLLEVRPYAPLQVDALTYGRRRVEHGLTTMGLKIHCLSPDGHELNRLVEVLGGRLEVTARHRYSHALASMTLVLPPVGSAQAAIWLLEAIELFCNCKLFGNPRIQLQVCSPCRLTPPHAAILAVAFYLGSDILRRYSLNDLTTTFSEDRHTNKHRGRRIVLYDGLGALDRDFEWWQLEGDRLAVLPQLPFFNERTDVLTCNTRVDLENVNLVATLLSHYQEISYWEHFGRAFIRDVEALLDTHMLGGILHTEWVHAAEGQRADDRAFFSALQELMSYAFDEHARLERERRTWWRPLRPKPLGILVEMRMLLRKYRELLYDEANRLSQEEAT